MRGLALVAGACALVVAGCGGSTGQPKDQVVAKANAICRSAENASKSFERTHPTTPTELLKVFSQLQPVVDHANEQLSALHPGGSDHKTFERFVDLFRQEADLFTQFQDSLAAGDLTGARSALAQTDVLDVRLDIAAQQYGISDCLSDDWNKIS